MLAALIARGKSGRGQRVDVGLLDAVAALLTYQAGRHFAGDQPGRTGNRHATIAPYDTYDTADGTLVLAVGNDSQWQSLCAVLPAPDLGADPRYRTNADRVAHYPELSAALGPILKRSHLEPLIDRLRAVGVPCGAVRSVAGALADPQIAARQMVETLTHPTIGPLQVLGLPVKLSETPGSVRDAPPRLGEHTRRVLEQDLGLSAVEVDGMTTAGVVTAS
jgi:formyl-CoA transferase/CoA:oxalate CoA-transferase